MHGRTDKASYRYAAASKKVDSFLSDPEVERASLPMNQYMNLACNVDARIKEVNKLIELMNK